MLARLRELAAEGRDFAFETTLASRSFAPWIAELRRDKGYVFRLNYLWIPGPELSIGRIKGRVRDGGHFVPDDVVRRRYAGGLRNFFELYQPIADVWNMFDNTRADARIEVATGSLNAVDRVYDEAVWNRIKEAWKR
jgi:predicted ABC-type ATPase